MKQAFELAAVIAVLSSGFAIADEPASGESETPVISPVENSGNSLPVLAEAQPPAKVPASRAARAEWQRKLEQRRLEMQRRGQVAPRGRERNKQARRGEEANSKEKRSRRGGKRRADDSKKPSQKKRRDSDKSKKPDSKPAPSKKPKSSDKPKSKKKPDAQKAPAKNAKKDSSSDLPIIVPMAVRVPSYAAVRATIPFSRSEWEADPSYRHNGTMELMLGQLRDMVVYRYPMAGPMAPGSGVTINNGGGSQFPNYGFGGFGGVPFGFNPGLNGVIQSRGIINSFQTQGFIGRGAPVLP
jgi:hypothetical protein